MPQLLARDPDADFGAAEFGRLFQQSTQRLISFVEEIGAASNLMLLDAGRARGGGTTDRNRLGESHRNAALFRRCSAGQSRRCFPSSRARWAATAFTYSRRITIDATGVLGAIVVEVDLQKFERAWAGISDAVLVTDSTGKIILATEARWRGLTEADALTLQTPEGAIQRAIRATTDWTALPPDAYCRARR